MVWVLNVMSLKIKSILLSNHDKGNKPGEDRNSEDKPSFFNHSRSEQVTLVRRLRETFNVHVSKYVLRNTTLSCFP